MTSTETAMPLFSITKASEIDALKSKLNLVTRERDVFAEMNAHLQEAVVTKDAYIIQKNKDIADLQNKLNALRNVVYTDNSAVIASLMDENKLLKETITKLQSNNK